VHQNAFGSQGLTPFHVLGQGLWEKRWKLIFAQLCNFFIEVIDFRVPKMEHAFHGDQ